MANRQTSDLGPIHRPQAVGQISTNLPSAVVDDGQAWRAIAGQAGEIGGRLRRLAADAATREAALAGLDAGSQAGSSYLTRRTAERLAVARAVKIAPDIDTAIAQAAETHGADAGTLRLIASLESGGDPSARNPSSSAGGLFQFIDSTAQQYGLADRFDAAQASDAAARLLNDNRSALSGALGRDPTPGELYLAHQQGADGAIALLTNPDAKAADLVGADAVRLNGGSDGMTAGAFARLWLKKAGEAGETAPAPMVDDGLSATPLALRNDGTLSGNAFDAAARRAFAWRMQEGLDAAIGDAAIRFADDPDGYAEAIGQVRATVLDNPALADPQLREEFEQRFAEITIADRLQILTRQEARLKAETQAAAGAALDAREAAIERQAFNLGGNGDAEAILGPLALQFVEAVDAAVASGSLSPQAGMDRKQAFAKSVASSRITGTFSAMDSPAAQEQFALGLLESWAAGEGPARDLGYGQVKALSATLYAEARNRLNRQDAETRVAAGRLESLIGDDVASMAATGTGVAVDGAPLDPGEVERLLGPEALAGWQRERERAGQLFEATNGMELASAEDIAGRLALLEAQPGQPEFQAQTEIAEAARKRAAEILKARAADPLDAAMRAGAIALEPLDLTSPEALTNSLAARRQDAEAVANLYQQRPVYFRPGERTALMAGFTENPDLLPAFAVSVGETFGEAAPFVLAELSADGPALAYAAGIGLSTNDVSVATDIARVLSDRAENRNTVKLPSGNAFAVAGAPLASAFPLSPRNRAAAQSVAQMLYEREAQLQGFDPADFDEGGTAAAEAWERSMDRALGGSIRNGVKYGGLVEVNGAQTVAPPDMPASRLRELVRGLTDEQVTALGVGSVDGLALTATDLRGLRLVPVGDGRYLMAAGDPNGPDPQFVPDMDGGFFELDIRALDDLAGTAAQGWTGGGWGRIAREGW